MHQKQMLRIRVEGGSPVQINLVTGLSRFIFGIGVPGRIQTHDPLAH